MASAAPTRSIPFGCTCGTVQGVFTDHARARANRVICYCADCQAFAHALGGDELLDPQAGSDIIQVAPASLRIVRGQHAVGCLRLTPRGLFRFYAACCNTPLGNCVSSAIPFVGVHRAAFRTDSADLDGQVGEARWAVHGETAIGGPPAGSSGVPWRLTARMLGKIAIWRLYGLGWPHPFFGRDGRPNCTVSVLSSGSAPGQNVRAD